MSGSKAYKKTIMVGICFFGIMGFLRSVQGDNVTPAIWTVAAVLLLILREIVEMRDDGAERDRKANHRGQG